MPKVERHEEHNDHFKCNELKGQSHQDLVLLENPVKVLLLIGNPVIIV